MRYTNLKMTGAVTLVLATVATGLGLDEQPPVQPVNSADRIELVKGCNAFAFDLYAKLRDDGQHKGKNVFFSPFSISTALAMTYGGARGSTAEEMAKAMHFTLGQEKLHPAVGALVRDLNGSTKQRNYKLNVANSLWGQVGYPFRPEFLALNKANYEAGLELVDFKRAPEQARQTINGWVERKTENRIKDLLPDDAVDDSTRLVLANAIYFKGSWHRQFEKSLTRDSDFEVKPGSKVRVPMMNRTGGYRYFTAEGFQAVELPYKAQELSMFVFLPKKADGLADLEKSLTGAQVNTWLAQPWSSQDVALTLPRFTITDRTTLKRALESLGMSKAFSKAITLDADFTGISGTNELFLKQVIHKAFVDVNEEGTEAAASTAVIGYKKEEIEPIPFRADHPFLFLIRDNASGSILFLGRVVDPSVK